MSISSSSSARRAGYKVNDKAIRDAAAIAMAKIGTRTLYIPIPVQAWHPVGASVAVELNGIAPAVNLPNANTGDMITSFRLPAEWASGGLTINVYWTINSGVGNVKLFVDMSSRASGGSTASEETLSVVTAAVANQIIKSTFTFTQVLVAGDLIGVDIERAPADAADTCTSDVKVVGVVAEYTGRG